MATQREEIIVRAGFDNTALASGLRQAGGMVQRFGQGVRNAVGGMFGIVSAAGFVSLLDRAFNRVKDISAASEKTGLDTSTFQQLSQIANKDLPEGAAKFETAITRLNVKIGEGDKALAKWGIHSRNAQDAIFEIADKMKAMPDPAERAAMAFDLMGRSGADMVPLLERGAVALKAMAAHETIFSKADIESIKEAHHQIDDMTNRLTIWSGKFISTIAQMAQTIGSMKIFGGGGVEFAPFIVDEKEAIKKKYERMNEESKARVAAEMKAEDDAAARAAITDKRDADLARVRAAQKAFLEHPKGLLPDFGAQSDAINRQAAADLAKVGAQKPAPPEVITDKQREELNKLDEEHLDKTGKLNERILFHQQAMKDFAGQRNELDKTSADYWANYLDLTRQINDEQGKLNSAQTEQNRLQTEYGDKKKELARLNLEKSEVEHGRRGEQAQDLRGIPTVEEAAEGHNFLTNLKRQFGERLRGPVRQLARDYVRQQYGMAADFERFSLNGGGDYDKFLETDQGAGEKAYLDRLRKPLSDLGIVPPDERLKGINDSIVATTKAITDLKTTLTAQGVKITE